MKRIRDILTRLPGWLLSGLTLLAILWLTLAPKPLGENPPPLFPGADKIAHGIMFGGFAIMILLDWQRKHLWRRVRPLWAWVSALISSGLGVVIEISQANMGLGRGFEYADITADILGAFFFAAIYVFFQNFWLPKPNK